MQIPITVDRRRQQLFELCSSVLEQHPLIVASNRGPLEYHLSPEGSLQPRRGSGAIVTALSSLIQNFEFTWVANAMGEGDRRAQQDAEGGTILSPLPKQKVSARYVITPRRMYHKFYNIFCNPLLWFLQHSMWSSAYTPNIDSTVHDAWTTGYTPVNQAFADAIVAEADGGPAPIVMVNDYHLYLVPSMVRKEIPDAIIQHNIHVPWPSMRIWQLLPTSIRTEICESLCASDVVSFQSKWDARSFQQCCEAFIPGADVNYAENIIEFNGHTTMVRAYPSSIDVEEIRAIAESQRAQEYLNHVGQFTAKHTIVRVDRAEPNKNIIRGFRAYQTLLDNHPELKEEVTFLAFLVPSRTHIKQYERYMEEIEALARQINAIHGRPNWNPIHIFSENNYTQAIAGLKLYDTLMVNPVVDGMNPVAKEGPIVNTKNGALVISEGSSAFEQLRNGALAVSPADIDGTANALYTAVTMSPIERAQRAATLVESIELEDSIQWLLTQFQDIEALF